MAVLRDEVREIRSSQDVVGVRQMVREWAVYAGFSLVDQTKIVTAASELARNTLTHGGGGSMRWENGEWADFDPTTPPRLVGGRDARESRGAPPPPR